AELAAIDREGFGIAMTRQREKARGAWAGSGEAALAPVYRTLRDTYGKTEFLGYDSLQAEAKILAIVKGGRNHFMAAVGEEVEIILDRTPFYAESGGQIGDTGFLDCVSGNAQVLDTYAPLKGLTVHRVKMIRDTFKEGTKVQAQVAEDRRSATINHHTATHLLQAALQETLGDHVHQAGSLVAPDRLRFDFTHFEGIDSARLQDIERLVNDYIRTDTEVSIAQRPLEEARAAGAMALFGEKYDDVVRVVTIGDISMELCGGTHVPRTGVIGIFKVLSEASISSGVRRIEALCGAPCVENLQAREAKLQRAAHALGTSIDDLDSRVQAIIEDNKRLAREVDKWKQAAATGGGVDYMQKVQQVDGLGLLAAEIDGQDGRGLRLVMDKLREKFTSGVIVLGGNADGKAALCVGVSKDLVSKIKAGDIIKELAPIVGGGGGGKPDMAQAGGKLGEKISEAIARAPEVVRALLR
ncbi:MAG: alanine--tRNA ligase-related protein, partial [Candidatus Hydrogenedentota bacterium]